MAKTLIPLEHYYQEEKFRDEQQRLFSTVWNFVGFTHQLNHDKDFLCKTIAGQPIVVRNFNGVLKAFSNICLHRLSLICAGETGNGEFQCPYHGWAYDHNGCVKGLPSKKEFDAQDYEGLVLPSYQLATCGRDRRAVAPDRAGHGAARVRPIAELARLIGAPAPDGAVGEQ